MTEIPTIQCSPCNSNNECAGDLCPKSATPICCKQCGSDEHIQQIKDNFEEISKDSYFTHPAIWQELEAVIHQVKTQYRCNAVNNTCTGTREFRLSVPVSSS